MCVCVQVFASMQDMLKTEENTAERLQHNIEDLAQQLYLNVSAESLGHHKFQGWKYQ